MRVGQDRLDRLLRLGQVDAVPGAQRLVQRRVPLKLPAQPGEAAGGQVRGVDRHRLAVGQPEPVDAEQPAARPHRQQRRQLLVGGDVADVQDLGLRVEAVLAHALGVARELERLGDLRLGDERALALHPQQAPLDDQFGQGLPHGRPRRPVQPGELALRRHRAAGRHGRREVEQMLLHLVVLGQPEQGRRRVETPQRARGAIGFFGRHRERGHGCYLPRFCGIPAMMTVFSHFGQYTGGQGTRCAHVMMGACRRSPTSPGT